MYIHTYIHEGEGAPALARAMRARLRQGEILERQPWELWFGCSWWKHALSGVTRERSCRWTRRNQPVRQFVWQRTF